MKNYFVYEFNKWLVENNLPVVQETKIHRTITYKEDYGELSATERMKLIGNDSFHVDKGFLENKTLIFLDDIRITGSHERMINKMIQEYALNNHTYLLYFAELTNTSIHPNIENYLNYSCIKSIFDLDPIIKNKRFSINTRLVKYLLIADAISFKIFIQNHSYEFMNLFLNILLLLFTVSLLAFSSRNRLFFVQKFSMVSQRLTPQWNLPYVVYFLQLN